MGNCLENIAKCKGVTPNGLISYPSRVALLTDRDKFLNNMVRSRVEKQITDFFIFQRRNLGSIAKILQYAASNKMVSN